MSQKVLVTVGTTEFEGLVELTSQPQFIKLLQDCNIKTENILFQIGSTGVCVPPYNYIRLSNNIQQIYDNHQIIISHGGAGTLLACLYSKNPSKKIITVANNTLAGNHQTEIVEKLSKQNYVLGFSSIQQMKDSFLQIKDFLMGKIQMKKFQRQQKCLLNHLIFGDDM